MKTVAQIVCAVLSISIVVKSFFRTANAVDAIILIAFVGVYSMYELLSDSKLRKELEEFKEKQLKRNDEIQKELTDTKNYMSKVSTSMALRK